jgi:protein SCO1/2
MTRRGLLALLAMLPAAPLRAEEEPGLAPPPDARLPPGLVVRDAAGRVQSMGEVLDGLPAVFAFADYGCAALCGTALGLAAAMLPETGLRPGGDYRLVVLGLDPRDGPGKATAMRRAWLGEGTALAATARFLVAEAPVVEAAMRALGYRARRRGEGFDHPLALFVLRGDGRLAAVLPALGAAPEELRAALRGAASEEAPGLLGRVQLLCEAATSGRGGVLRGALTAGGAATLALLGGGLLLLRRRERQV